MRKELVLGVLLTVTSTLSLESIAQESQGINLIKEQKREDISLRLVQLQEVAKSRPTSRLYEAISDAYLKLKDWSRALEAAEKSSQLDTSRWEPHINLSKCYNRLGDYELAVTHAKKAIRIDENEHSYGNFAAIIGHQGRYQEALKYFRKALQINPLDEYAKEGQARILMILVKQQ